MAGPSLNNLIYFNVTWNHFTDQSFQFIEKWSFVSFGSPASRHNFESAWKEITNQRGVVEYGTMQKHEYKHKAHFFIDVDKNECLTNLHLSSGKSRFR